MNSLGRTLNRLEEISNNVSEISVPISSNSFNYETFKKIKSYNKRVLYCNNNLRRMNSGSSRIIYQLNDNMVLKLAKNRKGIAQNDAETDIVLHNNFDDILTKVYDKDEDYLWLVADLAKKISPTRFEELAGVSFKDFQEYLLIMTKFFSNPNSLTNEENQFRSYIDDKENELIDQVILMHMSHNILLGDLAKLSSFGEVTRDGRPIIVITDYGLTSNVYDNYYS